MIKQLIIFVFVGGFLLIEGFAQSSSYFKMYGTESRDEGYFLKRTCDKGFILAGVTCVIDAYNDAYIIKLDSNGNILWNWNIGFGGAYDEPVSIMETPDSSIIVFVFCDASNVNMRMAVFDYDGNLVFEKHDYYLSDGFPDFSIKSASLLPDGRIVTPVVVNDSILKAYWWSQTGDTLFSATIDTCKQFPFSTHEIYSTNLFIDNDTLVFYSNNYFSSSIDAETIIRTDFNGVVFDEKSHVNGLGVSAPSATFIKNNRFVFTQNGTISSSVLCYLYDYFNDSIYKMITYSNPGCQISCQSLSTSSDTVFLLCGLTYNNLDSMSSYILKSDSSGNILWFRKYQPYGYDHSNLRQVFHFEDCIAAVGYAYNSTASPVAESYDILFVKADLNGNATSITTFEKPDNTLTVFPNPASDLLSVNLLPIGESVYTIVDAGGRELLKGKTPGNQISISSLPAGCYQLLWENDGKIYHAGFVKE